MEVQARHVDVAQAPETIASLVTPGQVFITPGKRYAVFAIASFGARLTLQVVDDLGYPAWLPASRFEVIDPALPSDWICSVFHDEPALLLT
jgi:hypothetical protein